MQFDHSYDSFWTVPSDLLHNCQSRMGGSFHLLHPGPPQTRHRHSSNRFLRETLLLASEGEVLFRSQTCFISCWTHQVKDADRVQTLGSLTIPLSRVMSSSNLSLDQWFQLDNSGSASRIYINSVLRVRKPVGSSSLNVRESRCRWLNSKVASRYFFGQNVMSILLNLNLT